MLQPQMQDALNRQLNAELSSSYLYLSMSAHFISQNLAGMANWMRIQAQEELAHVMKFFDHIGDRDGQILLTRVESPKTDWTSPLSVFEETLAHEQKVTGLVNDLVDLSLSQKDHASNTFLQWFVTEQVEEESTAKTIVDKLKLIGDNPVALYMLDGELGQRTFSPLTATTA